MNLKTLRFSACLVLWLCGVGTALADSSLKVDIPAGDLKVALDALSKQSGADLVYRPEQVKGLKTHGAHGAFTVEAAVQKLLEGTGLRLNADSSGAMLIAAPTAKPQAAAPSTEDASAVNKEAGKNSSQDFRVAQMDQANARPQAVGDDQNSEKKKQEGLTEIVVTGTHIRGTEPIGSSVTIYTREDIDQSGAATVDQFARVMPQNFSNTDGVANFSSNANFSPFSGTSSNISNSSAFNLHGLGPSATLTLINGHRVAPAGSDGSLTDISQIPLSAVDHIEVLSDGASAIYGADAVAGVVNIVTRKDFDGAETGVRYGAATDGGAQEVEASQLLGRSWGTGNALLTYEYDKQGGLDASQRSYIGEQAGVYSLVPDNRRNSALLSGSQTLGVDTTISAEAIYSDRHTLSQKTVPFSGDTLAYGFVGDEKQSGLTLSVEQPLAHDWRLSLGGDYSKLVQNWTQKLVSSSFGFTETIDSQSQLLGIDALANGSLFSVPGGPIKAAIGSSFRREQYGEDDFVSGTNSGLHATHRNVSSAFGEIAVPIIGEFNGLPGARRLDLSAAVRYDHYNDFGSTTNSKLGLAWQPAIGVTFRGTFGTSFKAPLLSQLHESIFWDVTGYPDPTSPTGLTNTLFQGGGNSNLGPEKARAFTVGFDLKPPDLPNFQLSANYFHINFDDRIESPPIVGTNIFTDVLAPFITRNPPLSVVQAAFNSPYFLGDSTGQGPAGVTAIFNDQIANIATTKESGIDLHSAYRIPTPYGQLGISLDIAHLFRNDFQTALGTPSFALLNIFGEPPKWKGRGGMTWTQGPLTAAAFVNYLNGYDNNLFSPAQPISAWTTGDLYFGFKPGNLGSSMLLRNLVMAMTVNNVTDKKPPYVQIPASDLISGQNPIPFDPTNASPVGRLISIQLTKGWGFR